jgi:hypothetical protein
LPPVKYGQPAHRKRHEGVSRIGQSMGNKTTEHHRIISNVERVEGGVIAGVGSVPLGNELAKNVGKGGPGAGRTLYGQCGTQGTHGPVNPGATRPGAGADILSDFGRDSSSVAGRK